MAEHRDDDTTKTEEEGFDTAPPLPGGADQAKTAKRRVRKRWIFLSIGTALLSLVLAAFVVSLLLVMGRTVTLPDWLTEEVQARINAEIEGPEIQLNEVRVGLLDDRLRPTVALEGLSFNVAGAAELVALPNVEVKLDTSELIQGRIALETLDIRNARINLTRGLDGQLAFAFGTELGGDQLAANSVAEVLQLVDQFFEQRAMRELEEVRVGGVELNLRDARLDRDFQVADGQLQLVNGTNFLALSVSFDISMDGGAPATLVLAADKAKGAGGGRFRASFVDLRMRDVAEQVNTLNFLGLLDAPVSGALTTEFGAAGELVSFAGSLDIGEGVLQPAPQAKALPLTRARTDVRYSSATGRLHLDGLEIDAPELRLQGAGHADLRDLDGGIPQTLLMQVRLADIALDPEGIFEVPIRFSEGLVDLRYRPTELELDLGQFVLRDGETEIIAGGDVSVGEAGWEAAIDARIGSITQSELLALWPTSAVVNTRKWLTENINSGNLRNVAAAVRVRPEQPASAAVTFDFDDANVRYMNSLPQVESARGYFTIGNNELTLAVHKGHVTAPEGGQLDVSGSVLQIPDVALDVPVAEIVLKAAGPIEAAMSLLDEKPFEFLTKSGLSTDLASGQAEVIAQLSVPLLKEVLIKDVGYSVQATLRDLQSDTLVPERSLRAPEMRLRAGDGSLVIEGPAALDGIPINVAWKRAIGPGSADGSTVTGTIALSNRTLDAFNVDLPDGSVSGEGVASVTLRLDEDQPPKLRLTSDLRGVGLAISALGWAKPQAVPGELVMEATLGATPQVDSLVIAAAGLEATGAVSVREGGGLDRAVFNPLRVAGRLNSRVEIIGQGAGRPALVAVRGGTIDIRAFGVTAGGGGSTGGGVPLDLQLDRLRVTDDIAIEGFQGKFRNAKGLDGSFSGKVNGQADVTGAVVPTDRGLAVRITSANGGGVVAATGIFRNARGGDLNLVLQPTGNPGEFDGRLSMADTRIKKAPALADLLSALSVVGLLEQLSGDGILFSEVEAYFTLSAGGVRLRESRAVGPSMGITMDGVYSTGQRRMQMQGVVSPLYLVNRPLGFLFSKKGEGLFGFNYTLDGSADAPKVAVNPLSVFTPGVFRQMFRRAPPKPQN